MSSSSNPYRIPKPKRDRLWKGALREANEKGTFKGSGIYRYEAVLTATHLWLLPELAIPLQTIREITPLNNGGGLRVLFHHALSGQDQVIHVCMLNFFSFPDRRRMTEMTEKLRQAWEKALEQAPGQGDIQAVSQALMGEAKCEKCGSPHALVLESGWLFSVGIAPFLWMEKWTPKLPYLCQRHAIQATCWYNFITSFAGCFGIPSILTGPWRVWRNSFKLKKTFPVGVTAFLFSAACGLVIPVTAFTWVWRWFTSGPHGH